MTLVTYKPEEHEMMLKETLCPSSKTSVRFEDHLLIFSIRAVFAFHKLHCSQRRKMTFLELYVSVCGISRKYCKTLLKVSLQL